MINMGLFSCYFRPAVHLNHKKQENWVSINIEDYILLAITSGEAKEEEGYLKTKGILPWDWSVLKVDKNGRTINVDNIIPSFLFVNQLSWEWIGEGLIKDLNFWQKQAVIYTHIGNNGIPKSQLKEVGRKRCFPFHHGDPDGMPLKNFLQLIREYPERFQEALRSLIIESVSGNNSHPLAILLPLDIDMQALQILTERSKNGETVKDPQDYLEEMYGDNMNYSEKLLDLQERLKEFLTAPRGMPDNLYGLINENVLAFFRMLDQRESNVEKILHHNWGISDVISFHDWYCTVAECLRSYGI